MRLSLASNIEVALTYCLYYWSHILARVPSFALCEMPVVAFCRIYFQRAYDYDRFIEIWQLLLQYDHTYPIILFHYLCQLLYLITHEVSNATWIAQEWFITIQDKCCENPRYIVTADWSTRFLPLMYINYKSFIYSIVNQDKILNGHFVLFIYSFLYILFNYISLNIC